MRLLHIINSLNTGGAEKLILDTLPLFAQKGIEVDLLLLMKTESPFLNKLKKEKCCKIFEFSYTNVYNPWMIFKIRKIITNYDIVHVHLFPALYWTALAYFFSRTKCKLIFTEHSTSNKRMRFRFINLVEKIIYKNYNAIIAITHDVKERIIKHIGNLVEIVVINNGTDIFQIDSIKGYEKNIFKNYTSKNDIFLIQVSSFRKAKDQPTLIKAMLHLPENIKLVLVGDGPLIHESIDLVSQLNLKKRVEFLWIRKDPIALIKTCNIAVLSSNWEGFGLVAIEAMASGKPLIASDVDGLREVVTGGGILFKKGDDRELASLIIELLEKPKYYQEVANRCVNRAKDYDTSFMVEKTINLYNKLIE